MFQIFPCYSKVPRLVLYPFACSRKLLCRFLKFVESCFGCRLNEEMIETLFMINNSNNSNMTLKDGGRRVVLPSVNLENRVLDPKKSQNIAILLRALDVTIEEVCEALLEGS